MSMLKIGDILLSQTGGGGGGEVTSVYNTGFSATATASATAQYIAQQKVISESSTSYVNGDPYITSIYGLNVKGVSYNWGDISAATGFSLTALFDGPVWSQVSAASYTGITSVDPQAAWPKTFISSWGNFPQGQTVMQWDFFEVLGPELRGQSSQWSYYTPINIALYVYNAQNFTGHNLTGQAEIVSVTGTSYPYPTRPATEYVTASGQVTAYEYVSPSQGICVSASGSASSHSNYGEVMQPTSYNATNNSVSASVTYAKLTLTAALNNDSMSYYFPSTAYTWTKPYSYTVASGVSGLI